MKKHKHKARLLACLVLLAGFSGFFFDAKPTLAASVGPTEYYCDIGTSESPFPEPELATTIFADTGTAQCTDHHILRNGRSGAGRSFSWTFSCPGSVVPTLTPENNSDGDRSGFVATCGSSGPATIAETNNRVDTSDLVAIACADGTQVAGTEDELDSLCAAHGGRVTASSLEADCTTLDASNCGILSYLIIFINIMSALVGVIVVIMIVYGGIQYTMARDNPQGVTAARERIINAILALVVYLGMTAFLQWIVPGGIFNG